MPQRKQLTWSELRVGLFVLVGLAVLAVGIFYVTGAGVFGPKYRLKTYLPEVSGLAAGAPVRLDGVNVGNVEQIKLVPRERGKSPDRMHNIEIDMRLDRKYQNDILTDSTAVLVTEGLLGNRYVNIERGYTGMPLKDGQVVPGTEEKAIKEVVERSADVLSNLQALSDDVKDLVNGVQSGRGSLGKLLTDDQAYNHLNSILTKGDKIVGNVQAGQGTIGKLIMTDEMSTKVENTVDQLNTILADLRAQKGTLGKLLYDPTLYDQAKSALDNGNNILSDVRAGKGTLGKLATDETLYNKLRDTSSNLSTATAKLNENTNTAGKIFTDPKLYDNLTGVTGDMRQLLADFRQNPKKFLTIKLNLF
ncbi:MAG TPA: MlaD family protein [Candidatus Acidoferrum sp.]|jgi:phospholipid/cholesterol/gamma-HCH transport system substrate-binding protein